MSAIDQFAPARNAFFGGVRFLRTTVYCLRDGPASRQPVDSVRRAEKRFPLGYCPSV